MILRQIPESKYIPAIKWGYMSGILVGDNGVDLRLNEFVTRAEVITMVKKAESFNGEYKKSLSDNVSDVLLKSIYERLDLFDSAYSRNEHITNGEICNAAVRIMTYKHNPQFSASKSKKADTKYSDALYFVTDGVLEHYNNKEFAESDATGKTAIELLTYAYIYAHGNDIPKNVNNYYPGLSGVENVYENMFLTYAYQKGVLIDFGYNIEQKITKAQLVSVLIQLEHVLPSQKSYCGGSERFERMDFSVPKFTGLSQTVPLFDLSSKVYSKSFYGCDLKAGYRFARDYPNVVSNIVNDITKVAKNNGASVIIRYYPTLIAVSDNETILRCRVYCENNKNDKKLSAIFGRCEKNDIQLKDNTAYVIDLSVGNKELYLNLTPVNKVNVKQVVWCEQ